MSNVFDRLGQEYAQIKDLGPTERLEIKHAIEDECNHELSAANERLAAAERELPIIPERFDSNDGKVFHAGPRPPKRMVIDAEHYDALRAIAVADKTERAIMSIELNTAKVKLAAAEAKVVEFELDAKRYQWVRNKQSERSGLFESTPKVSITFPDWVRKELRFRKPEGNELDSAIERELTAAAPDPTDVSMPFSGSMEHKE